MAVRTIIPKNCTQCERSKICKSYFGGLGCGYKEEITKKAKDNNKA